MNQFLALLILSIGFLISSEINAASLLRETLKKSKQNLKNYASRRLSSASTETAPSKSHLKSIGTVTGLSLLGSAIAYKHQEAYEKEAEEIHVSIISNQKINLPRVSLPFLLWETSLGKASLYEIALKQENFFQANLLLQRTAGLMKKNMAATKEILSAEKDYMELLDKILSGKIENLALIPVHKLTRRLHDGRNLISIAVENENFALVEKLVERGVDLVSGEENPTLCSSDQELNISILQDVLAGKSVDISVVSSDVLEHIDSDGQSIFKAAVLRKDYALMKQLVGKNLNYYRELLKKNSEQADFEKDLFSKQMKVLNSQVKDLSTVPLKVLNSNMPDGHSLVGTALSSFEFGIVAQLLQRGVDFRLLDLTRKAAFVHKTITYDDETESNSTTETESKNINYLTTPQKIIEALSNQQDFDIIKEFFENGEKMKAESAGGNDLLLMVYLENYENKNLADIQYLHEKGFDMSRPDYLYLAKQQYDFSITNFILGEFIKHNNNNLSQNDFKYRDYFHFEFILADSLKFREKYDKSYLIDGLFPGEEEFYERAFKWISDVDILEKLCNAVETEIENNKSESENKIFSALLQKLLLQTKFVKIKEMNIFAAIKVQKNFNNVIKKLIEQQEADDVHFSRSVMGEKLLECYIREYKNPKVADIEYIIKKWRINIVHFRVNILEIAVSARNIELANCILGLLVKQATNSDSSKINTIIVKALLKYHNNYKTKSRNDSGFLFYPEDYKFFDLAFEILSENYDAVKSRSVERFFSQMAQKDQQLANYLRNLYWKKLSHFNKKTQQKK